MAKDNKQPKKTAEDLSTMKRPQLMELHYDLVNVPEKEQDYTLTEVEIEIHNRTKLI